MRDALVSARTQIINTVRGWMRGCGARIRPGHAETFHQRVRQGVPSAPEYVLRQLDVIEG